MASDHDKFRGDADASGRNGSIFNRGGNKISYFNDLFDPGDCAGDHFIFIYTKIYCERGKQIRTERIKRKERGKER